VSVSSTHDTDKLHYITSSSYRYFTCRRPRRRHCRRVFIDFRVRCYHGFHRTRLAYAAARCLVRHEPRRRRPVRPRHGEPCRRRRGWSPHRPIMKLINRRRTTRRTNGRRVRAWRLQTFARDRLISVEINCRFWTTLHPGTVFSHVTSVEMF